MRIKYENLWKDFKCLALLPTIVLDLDSGSIGFLFLWFGLTLEWKE